MNVPPPTALTTHEIPSDLADALQTVFGTDARPETLADFVSQAGPFLSGASATITTGDLCTTNRSRHVAYIDGGRQYFHCVFDTLVVPFLFPTEAPVEAYSTSPIAGDTVELAIWRDFVDVHPAGAVMSFGLATDPDVPPVDASVPELAYRLACPYINAFPSHDAYEHWTTETPDAATMAVSMPVGLTLAQALAETPQSDSN